MTTIIYYAWIAIMMIAILTVASIVAILLSNYIPTIGAFLLGLGVFEALTLWFIHELRKQ